MEWTLNMNITITFVVTYIVIARKLFLYRISGSCWLLLWKIFLLRLLCPFTPELQLKNASLGNSMVTLLQKQEKLLPVFDSFILKIIWFIGAIGVAGCFIGFHLAKRRQYCMALPVNEIYFENWKQSHVLKRKFEIRESDRIAIPLTYGIIKPVILLPARRNLKHEQLDFVLEHEFIHIKRWDVLLKWILVFVCSIYWYHPFIWIMYLFVNRDIELTCDETLFKHRTHEHMKSYLNLLILLEEKKSEKEFLCSAFCKHPIEERIRVMTKTKKEKKRLLSRMIICLLVILMVGITTKYSFPKNNTHSNLPSIVGHDEEQAFEILHEHGFSAFIENP